MPFALEPAEGRDPFHAGEHEAHQRFGSAALAREMQGVIVDRLSAEQARLMLAQPFFFISLLGLDGRMVAEVVPRVAVEAGAYPLVAIASPTCFHFMLGPGAAPLVSGALHDGPRRAGLIFVDFSRRRRLRVNGRVHPDADGRELGFEVPSGARLMRLEVEQAYSNCGARVVGLTAHRGSPHKA